MATQKSSLPTRIITHLLSSRFGGAYVIAAVFLTVWFLLRVTLCISSSSEAHFTFQVLCKTFLVGFVFDLVTVLYIIAPIVIILTFSPLRGANSKFNRVWSNCFYFILLCVLFFEVGAEWFFWDEFSNRFNFIAVDYLIYAQEVVTNIWQSYSIPFVLGAIIAVSAIVFVFTRKMYSRSLLGVTNFSQRIKTAIILLIVPILAAFFMEISFADIGSNQFSNELAKNGVYSFVEAFKANTINYKKFYISKDDTTVFLRLKELIKTDNAKYLSDDPFDITRQITSPPPEQKYNVIIIVVESLSASYLGVFGNTAGLTPHLDELASSSLFFRNCYATGTRTTRGLEAIALSLPPTPGQSVVKRVNHSGMFSIGTVFTDRNYETKFIYAGRGFFDNMNDFFAGNGFTHIDQTDFDHSEITFKNAWGVCDEDLYNKVLREADKSYQNGKLFCSVVLTTSNHRPYTYPQKIDIPSGTGRNGAIKYTDYAIGQLLAMAKQKAWFDNTVFVIVADHCANSAGKVAVPVDKYHIPLFIYAPKLIQSASIDTLCSQIDVTPTLLELLNFSYKSKFFGQDVLSGTNERALMGTYQKVGLYRNHELTLLLPKKEVAAFQIDAHDVQNPADVNAQSLFDTIAYYQTADYLLKNNLDRSK